MKQKITHLLAGGYVLFASVIFQVWAPSAFAGEMGHCEVQINKYQWLRVFSMAFPLPRELSLLVSHTPQRYFFQEGNFPGNSILSNGAVFAGSETEFQSEWISKEYQNLKPDRSTRRGKLLVEEFDANASQPMSFVHITDGRHYVVLTEHLTARWQELITASEVVARCNEFSR